MSACFAKVTLTGPDDLGRWFLDDENGNSLPLVERHEEHPGAAELFGWTSPDGITAEEEIIQDALDWLMENIGEEIDAPPDAVAYFEELEAERDEE
jgi:hypothetical protein